MPDGTEAPRTFPLQSGTTPRLIRRHLWWLRKQRSSTTMYLATHSRSIQTTSRSLGCSRQTSKCHRCFRCVCCSIFLNGYQYSLLHRLGKQLGHPGVVSRLPLMHQRQDDPSPAEVGMLLDILSEFAVHADDVARHSAKDGILFRVLNWVWRGWPRCTASS